MRRRLALLSLAGLVPFALATSFLFFRKGRVEPSGEAEPRPAGATNDRLVATAFRMARDGRTADAVRALERCPAAAPPRTLEDLRVLAALRDRLPELASARVGEELRIGEFVTTIRGAGLEALHVELGGWRAAWPWRDLPLDAVLALLGPERTPAQEALLASWWKPEPSRQQIGPALAAFRTGDAAAAEVLLGPYRHAGALYLAGMTLRAQGRTEEADASFAAVLEQDPTFDPVAAGLLPDVVSTAQGGPHAGRVIDLPDGRVRIEYRFEDPAELADWCPYMNSTWRVDRGLHRGAESWLGGLIHCLAMDVEVVEVELERQRPPLEWVLDFRIGTLEGLADLKVSCTETSFYLTPGDARVAAGPLVPTSALEEGLRVKLIRAGNRMTGILPGQQIGCTIPAMAARWPFTMEVVKFEPTFRRILFLGRPAGPGGVLVVPPAQGVDLEEARPLHEPSPGADWNEVRPLGEGRFLLRGSSCQWGSGNLNPARLLLGMTSGDFELSARIDFDCQAWPYHAGIAVEGSKVFCRLGVGSLYADEEARRLYSGPVSVDVGSMWPVVVAAAPEPARETWLRIRRSGGVYWFDASPDGSSWTPVLEHFPFGPEGEVRLWAFAYTPMDAPLDVTVDGISLRSRP
ncbi:MAG: hypothetical protein HY720_26795 [Planctomycetes bacterium]|nr:hypothetical protein [Planctomycetota bacterium]